MFIERIIPDTEFWAKNVKKTKDFVLKGVLPELVAKWFSRPPKPNTRQPTEEQFCYCGGKESGEMIACDNDACPYQWFHFVCLHMEVPPKPRRLYCPDCQKENNVKKKAKSKRL